jgi:hypothetical protein
VFISRITMSLFRTYWPLFCVVVNFLFEWHLQ